MARCRQLRRDPCVKVFYGVEGAIAEDLVTRTAPGRCPLLQRVFASRDAVFGQMIGGVGAGKELLSGFLHLLYSFGLGTAGVKLLVVLINYAVYLLHN